MFNESEYTLRDPYLLIVHEGARPMVVVQCVRADNGLQTVS
jgi:hypothetical protein